MLLLRKGFAIKPGLLAYLPNGAHQIILILVDLSSWKAPARALLPPLHEHALVHGEIQDDGAAHGDPRLVGHEIEERIFGAVGREPGDQRERTYGEDFGQERAEVEGGQARVDFANKVLKVPLRSFNLERQSLRKEKKEKKSALSALGEGGCGGGERKQTSIDWSSSSGRLRINLYRTHQHAVASKGFVGKAYLTHRSSRTSTSVERL